MPGRRQTRTLDSQHFPCLEELRPGSRVERKIPRAGVRGRRESRKQLRGHRHDSQDQELDPGLDEDSWDSWNSCQLRIIFICKECLRSCANIQEKAKGRQKLFFQVKVVEVTTAYRIGN